MGRIFLLHLVGPSVYACKCCGTHLADPSELLSKNFHSRSGPALLFISAINITLGEPEERQMTTGRHIVRDVHCLGCNWLLGWRYEYAYSRRESYKEGKVILERARIFEVREREVSSPSPSLSSTLETLSLVSDVDECCY